MSERSARGTRKEAVVDAAAAHVAAATKPVPMVLLPYQQRWIDDKAQVRVCEKSRRVGLSWASAAEAVLTAASESGMDVWYVGYNREMAQEFIRDCADWTMQFTKVGVEVKEELVRDGDKDILQFTIRFASGFRISALSSRPSNLRGKQGLVIIDEAAFHDNLKELLKAALALLMWGGRVAIISTHDGAENPFNELVTDIRAGKVPYSIHRITLDEALTEGLYERICLASQKNRDPKKRKVWSPEAEKAWREELVAFYGAGADEELFCIPRNSGGAFLSRALVESRMVPATVHRLSMKDDFARLPAEERERIVRDWCIEHLLPDLQKLPDLPHALGEDFGRTLDLTVLVPVTVGQRMIRTVPFVVELRNVPFEQQRQVLFFIIDGLPRFFGAALDATGNGAYLAEVTAQAYGDTRVAQVKISQQWYADHLPPLKAAFEDGSILIPADPELLDDLRAFQVIKGIPKLPDIRKGKAGQQRHGDAGVAIAMAFAASRLDIEEYGFIPVRPSSLKRDPYNEEDDDLPAVGGFGFRNTRGGYL